MDTLNQTRCMKGLTTFNLLETLVCGVLFSSNPLCCINSTLETRLGWGTITGLIVSDKNDGGIGVLVRVQADYGRAHSPMLKNTSTGTCRFELCTLGFGVSG